MVSVNYRLKAIYIIGLGKIFYRKRFSGSRCAMKTVDIDVLVISRNCDRNNHAMYQYNEQTYLENKRKEPVEPVQKNIYRSNTYRKDLSWPLLKDEPRVQERQQVKDQKCCISAFVAYLTIPSGNQTQAQHDNRIPRRCIVVWQIYRDIEQQSNLQIKKLHRTNHVSNFLGDIFSCRKYVRALIQFRREIQLHHLKR